MKLYTVCFALLSLLALLEATEAVIPFIAFWAVGGSTAVEFLAKITAFTIEKSRLKRTGDNLLGDEVGLTTFTRGSTIYNIMVCNKLAHQEVLKLDRPFLGDIEDKIEHWVHGFGFYEDVSVIYSGGATHTSYKCGGGGRGGLVKCCNPH
ncbi:hypothetical protein BGX27_004562, partial [Mortierella sp. AM989]